MTKEDQQRPKKPAAAGDDNKDKKPKGMSYVDYQLFSRRRGKNRVRQIEQKNGEGGLTTSNDPQIHDFNNEIRLTK